VLKPLFEVEQDNSVDAWWDKFPREKYLFCGVCKETTPHELVGQAVDKGVVSYLLYRCQICNEYKEVKL